MEKQHFFQEVYEVVKLVPIGRVTTYGAIAAYIGHKSSARIVGWAMNASPSALCLPVHRVVNRLGVLSGKSYFAEPNMMQRLLEDEGILVENDKIQNLNQVLWDPSIELTL